MYFNNFYKIIQQKSNNYHLIIVLRLNSTSSYEYLHKSVIPTYKFQKSLPRLPIPELNKTCQRYLDAIKPIIASQQQYDVTKNITKIFETGEGTKLNKELHKWDKKNINTSYLSEFWFDVYLKSRDPLPLNFNPFLELKPDPNNEFNSQLLRTSNLIISAMRFRKSLVEQILEPELVFVNRKNNTRFYRNIIKLTPSALSYSISAKLFNCHPIDMSQFNNLFASTRIPCVERDKLVVYPNSKHIAILKSGQFYIFDVLDENGNIKDPSEILTCIKYVLEQPIINQESITYLTTENRDVWVDARDNLINSSVENAENIKLIDSAQFIFCIDDLLPKDNAEVAHNYLHGCNKNVEYLNRWFDKSFSLIISKDGNVGINWEHSWGDGVTIIRFLNDIFNDSTNNHFAHSDTPVDNSFESSKVKKLNFNLNDSLLNSIKHAKTNFLKNTRCLELSVLNYNKMNRSYFKKKQLSPDSMFQLGFQMAFNKLYNYTCATYEACSTANFNYGRTEILRSATQETNRICDQFAKDQKPNTSEIKSLLKQCSNKHVHLAREASLGQGFDRHLFALKVIAQRDKLKLPELYVDKSYNDATHYVLSTSALYSKACTKFGFAPVVPDGYGCGYGYLDKSLFLILSSYSPNRNNQQFGQAFQESLDQIYKVLEQ